jgi:hypothetical protein
VLDKYDNPYTSEPYENCIDVIAFNCQNNKFFHEKFRNSLQIWLSPGLNWGSRMCEASVITTTLLNHIKIALMLLLLNSKHNFLH